jgi:F420-dependent oxidoreductase-like protein
MPIRIPFPSLIVLIGPSGSGKTTWAEANFRPGQVVSSDALRAAVGTGEHDQKASSDAFAVLESIVDMRLKRGLVTVIDTLGLNADDRLRWRQKATDAGMPAIAIAFDTDPKTCKDRNKRRSRSIPPKVLDSQITRYSETRPALEDEGFAAVYAADVVTPVGLGSWSADQVSPTRRLRFGLQVSNFEWGDVSTPDTLAAIARRAEAAGFESLWLMDHFRQIPQVGPAWNDMLEAYTTLAWLAGVTDTIKLGALVTGLTYRNVGLLAKIISTLDVLSEGRAICGIGAGWFKQEHEAFGYVYPPDKERLDLLEDALQALPILWGAGAKSFEGKVVSIPEALAYPRPVQEHIPILVGGSGEKRTLKLVAQYADACNLMGGPDDVRHKLAVLHAHCEAVGRDRSEIEVTHLSPTFVYNTTPELEAEAEAMGMDTDVLLGPFSGGTVTDNVTRFSGLSEAGVDLAIVAIANLHRPGSLETFGEVIEVFSV